DAQLPLHRADRGDRDFFPWLTIHLILPGAERTGKVLRAGCCVLGFDSACSTQHSAHLPTPWSRSVYSGSKRHVVLGSLLCISYLLDELFEMLGRVNEIDPVRIHHQERRLFIPVKVVRVRLAELLQIR